MAKTRTAKKEDSIIPQAKLLRLFQIIVVLKSGHHTVEYMAERFSTSTRTIYRYLKLLEEVDFMVEKDFHGRYFIITSADDPGNNQFTISETRFIKKLIQSGARNNPMKNILLRKLSFNSEVDQLPKLFVDTRIGKFVELLAAALQNKTQVILRNYHSASSAVIRDRLIEPIRFGDNYGSVWALDVQDKVCKQFKLERIADVIPLNNGYQHQDLHLRRQQDAFGFSGEAETWVVLELSMRAYLLMREEFPQAIPYLKKEDERFLFHGPVFSLNGIGRFVLGLVDEITVIDPPELKEYITGKISMGAARVG